MSAPTLARRYIVKLGANLASVPLYLAMEAILPRALGPVAYGNYNFATSLFQQFCGFLDMGASTCFYNALSRRRDETSLFSFYLLIALATFVLIMAAGFVLLWPPAGSWLLPDAPLWIAPCAAFWAWLTWWSRVLRSMNDALGATIPSEIWRACIALFSVLLLAGLFFGQVLNMASLFAQQYLLLGTTALACWHVSRQWWLKSGITPHFRLHPGQAARYAREFFTYSHPLFTQALLSFLMLALERWLLQWFDGSAQQGFYSLSQKVSMACFLFASAMTPLIMREFSIAWGRDDPEAMAALLRRFAPLLYALVACFSCFTIAEGKAIVNFFGGAEFAAALLPVQIMALYPVHQAYGQIAGAVFHASGKTWVLRNVTALECVYGLACAWFLLAPAQLGGLNLGAAGLALKTVGVQMVSVNIYLWLASRFIPFSFWKNLAHQITAILALLGLAFLASQISRLAPVGEWLRFLISGSLYLVLTGVLWLGLPGLLGLNRAELYEIRRRFLRF